VLLHDTLVTGVENGLQLHQEKEHGHDLASGAQAVGNAGHILPVPAFLVAGVLERHRRHGGKRVAKQDLDGVPPRVELRTIQDEI
jgi:hypothetical protein